MQDAAASTIGTWADFEATAAVRLAAVERDLTAAVARQAQAARTEAETARAETATARAEAQALNAELARGPPEQLRLTKTRRRCVRRLQVARRNSVRPPHARWKRRHAPWKPSRRSRGHGRQAAEAAAWKAAYADLERTFQREIAAKEVALQRLAHGVSLTITDRILFPSGTADIVGDGVQVLNRIAGVLERFPASACGSKATPTTCRSARRCVADIQQLGAVDGAGHGDGEVPRRTRRRGVTDGRSRLRGYPPGCPQYDGGGSRAEPPHRSRPRTRRRCDGARTAGGQGT